MASSSLDLLSDSLNLEDLKAQLSSCCSTCGVCWTDDHFSFDCRECGGYAKIRPCSKCDGNCGSTWTRDYTMVSLCVFVDELNSIYINQRSLVKQSHAYQTAKWSGSCKFLMPHFEAAACLTDNDTMAFVNGKTCGSHFFPSDLCNRLEKLSTRRIQS